MTNNPPPANVIRCHLKWAIQGAYGAGSRFFAAWSGATPSLADVTLLETYIAAAYVTYLQPLATTENQLVSIECTDLSSPLGKTFHATTAITGTSTNTPLPTDVCSNIGFNVARRYRGGRPKIFLPFGCQQHLADESHWNSGWITQLNTAFTNFINTLFAAPTATTLTGHVNVSFYSGYITVGPLVSGKLKYPPKARTTALIDPITGREVRPLIASQRRRRLEPVS